MAPLRILLVAVVALSWGCGRSGPLAGLTDPSQVAPDSGVTSTPAADDLSNVYCKCMRSYCFTFSPGDVAQEPCVAVANQVPRKGAATTTGNFIECRIHYCTVHITSYDDNDCRRAAGASVCVGPE